MGRHHRRAVGGSVLFFTLLVLCLGTVAVADDDARGRVLYLLLVDTSTSMRDKPEGRSEAKMATVRRVLSEFMESVPSETDVYLATFDEGIQREWKRRILSDADRKTLADLVRGMQPIGSATHAWPSLAEMLNNARKWLSENRGGEVRLFVYTDGEDNSGTKLETVLAPYRDLLTSEEVRASFYTLGFTLRKGLPEALEALGIRVRAVPDLSDLAPPLTASFDWSPSRPGKGTNVLFRDRSTGWIKTYRWSFGDGGTSTDKAPAHAYAKDGTFTVKLDVIDSTGQRDAMEHQIVVLPPADPVVDFVAGRASAEMGDAVTFVERCEGAVQDFTWDFGDGTSGSGPTVQHAWKSAGSFDVVLSVTGPGGKTFASAPKTVRITAPAAPTVELVVPQEGVPVGTNLRFYGEAQGQVETVHWDFGDGATSDERHPEHRFSEPGTYKVVLTVSGPGGTRSAEAMIDVLPPEKPVASFSVGTAEPRVGQEIRFTNTSTGTVERVVWSFGDGSADVTIDLRSASGEATHRYRKQGAFTVTLTAEGAGASSEASETITVVPSNEPPAAAFTWHLGKKYGAMEVRFENQSTGAASGFTWNFGDGAGPSRTKEHGDVTKELEPGTYEVTLIAHGAEGFADSRISRTVEVPHPPTFFQKYRWAFLLVVIVLILLARGLVKSAKAKREAIEATYIAGTVEVLDEDSGDWHTLGSSEYGEPSTELAVSASSLGDSGSGPLDRMIVKAEGEAYVADVFAGGHGQPVARIRLTETMPGSSDHEGSWDRFLIRFRS